MFEFLVLTFVAFLNIIESCALPLLEPTDAKELGFHLLSSRLCLFHFVAAAVLAVVVAVIAVSDAILAVSVAVLARALFIEKIYFV